MLKIIVLIFSFCYSAVVFGQDLKMVPNHNLTGCALSLDCNVVFADAKSGSENAYTVKMFDIKDVQMSDETNIVLKMFDAGKPFFVGIGVATSEDIDSTKAIQETSTLNTYTSFAHPKIIESGKIDQLWSAAVLAEAVVTNPEPSPDKKPPPKCPPTCNNRFYFVPAAEYMSEYGDSLKSMMAIPSLVPVLIPN